jgi:hypothetical protein
MIAGSEIAWGGGTIGGATQACRDIRAVNDIEQPFILRDFWHSIPFVVIGVLLSAEKFLPNSNCFQHQAIQPSSHGVEHCNEQGIGVSVLSI